MAFVCSPSGFQVVSVDHHETLHVLATRLLASKSGPWSRVQIHHRWDVSLFGLLILSRMAGGVESRDFLLQLAGL